MLKKIEKANLGIFETIFLTYKMFFKSIYIFSFYIFFYLVLARFMNKNINYLLPVIFIFLQNTLQFIYYKEIRINIFNEISVYLLLMFFIKLLPLTYVIFLILPLPILFRNSNFADAIIIYREMFFKKGIKIIETIIIQYLIIVLLFSAIIITTSIYNGVILVTQEEVINYIIKYNFHIYIEILNFIILSITNFIIYKNLEKNLIMKGE